MSLDDIIKLDKKKEPQEDGFIREAGRVAHIVEVRHKHKRQ
jgi:hypothetical protein